MRDFGDGGALGRLLTFFVVWVLTGRLNPYQNSIEKHQSWQFLGASHFVGKFADGQRYRQRGSRSGFLPLVRVLACLHGPRSENSLAPDRIFGDADIRDARAQMLRDFTVADPAGA